MKWITQGETLIEAIERTKNRSRGFDYMRIGLALAVVLWHSTRVSYEGMAMTGWYRPFFGMVLPMFFALSGYLVSGSLMRVRSVHEFVALRAMRIIPALAVDTTIAVLIIGTSFTVLPLSEYFSRRETWEYLLNILGVVHFRLPGVFLDNPKPGMINASLWTIPFELECYLLIVLLRIFGILKSLKALIITAIVLQIAVPLLDQMSDKPLGDFKAVPGRVLVLAFVYGVIIFMMRSRVILNFPLFIVSLGMGCLLLLNGEAAYFVGLPAAYAAVYLGMRDPPKIPVLMDGDYSYGIYLYSYPIQQAITHIMPSVYREWWINFLLTLPLVALSAAFSWHVVEKPILSQRKQIVEALDRWMDHLKRRKLRGNQAVGAAGGDKAEAAAET